MCPVNGRRPFTEMVEAVQNELIREAATGEEPKYKGLINQVYLNDLVAALPERYIKKKAFVTTLADYTTGTVTVGSGTALINGASTSWTSAISNDTNIRVSGSDEVFRVTYSADTLLTSKDSLSWTGSTGSGLGYTIYQDRYQVASDFNYMIKDDPDDPNVVSVQLNGAPVYLTPWNNDTYDRNLTSTVGSIHAYTVKWISGSPYIYVQNNPDISENLGYEYIPVLTQLREHTTGTATLTTGTAVVLTSNASITSSVDTAGTLYIRNDVDGTGSASRWFKIASVADDSTATLSSNFTGTSGTGISYTIAEISKWPTRFDDVMMYKSAWIADPDGIQAEKWLALVTDALGAELTTETKRKRGQKLKHFPGMR